MPAGSSRPRFDRPGANVKVRDRALVLLAGASALTLALYLVPYGRIIAYPFVLLSTFAHEMGHGLTAIALGGEFTSLVMHPDASGVASFRISPGRLARGAVAAGGLLGPALAALGGFVLATRPKRARAGLVVLGAVSVLAVALWVRSLFGVVFVLGLGAGLIAVGWKSAPRTSQWVLVFLAVQLSLSVFSRSDYLFTETAGSGPSDVAQMASAWWLPYWLWGVVCGAISVLALGFGITTFARRAT